MPIRIQRRRVKGWRMPPDTVSITRPGRWGNENSIADGIEIGYIPRDGTPREQADAGRRFYRDWLHAPEQAAFRAAVRAHLRGLNLACFCAESMPCHGDVLLELANS